MLSRDCGKCKYLLRMIGVGLGIRCSYDENQHYVNEDSSHKKLPVIISAVPEGCLSKQ